LRSGRAESRNNFGLRNSNFAPRTLGRGADPPIRFNQDCAAFDIVQLLLSLRLVKPHLVGDAAAAIPSQFTMCSNRVQVAITIQPLRLAYILIISFKIVEALN
jgi:hypothetical protein